MTPLLTTISIALLTFIVGILLGNYIKGLKVKSITSTLHAENTQFTKQIEQLEVTLKNEQQQLLNLRDIKEDLGHKLTKYTSEIEHLKEKNSSQKIEMEALQEKFSIEFENLAHKILEANSAKFTAQNKESITGLLSPLQEKITRFEKKVEDTQKTTITMHAALRQQLTTLETHNTKISKEAENLTKALKADTKMQGNWGELVLERVLEKSGLRKDHEYTVQQSFATAAGKRLVPDVIIHLPDNKKMVVDSKVSLVAYERFVNAEEPEQASHLKDHITSLKRHVDQLSAKKYEDIYEIDSPDFVLLFVPIEPAFAIAVNSDTTLYTKAFEQNIVIVTPSTLLATLRTIDTMWNNEKQQRNAIEIARLAGSLYDKFNGLITDLKSVGAKLDSAKGEYSAAMNKLYEGKGNLIVTTEKLKKMGAKAKKSLPESDVLRAKNQ